MLLEMAFVLFRVFSEDPGIFTRELSFATDQRGKAFRSNNFLSDLRVRSFDLAAHAGHANTVFIFELDCEVIVDITAAVCVILSPTHSIGLDGMSLHDPVASVKVVDVLLDDVIAAKPVDVEPVVEMVIGKCHPTFTFTIPDIACVEVGVKGLDIPEFTVMNGSNKVRVMKYVAAVEAGQQTDSLSLYLALEGEYSAYAR